MPAFLATWTPPSSSQQGCTESFSCSLRSARRNSFKEYLWLKSGSLRWYSYLKVNHTMSENLKSIIFTIPGIIQGTYAVGDRVGMMGTILEFCLPHNATRPCLFSPRHCQITKIGWNFNDEVSVAQFKKTFHRNKHIVLLEAGKNRVILSALIYQ